MKKIIIFYDYFTPAKNAGGIVRSVNNLISLLSQDFEFYIFTSAYDLGIKRKLVGVTHDGWTSYGENAKVYYASRSPFFLSKVRREIANIQPDVIYVNGIFSLRFSIAPIFAARQQSKPPLIVLCPRGMVQKGALGIKPMKKKIYLSLIRYFNFYRHIRWHATDKQEFADIKTQFGTHSKIVLAFLALDTPSLYVPEIKILSKSTNRVRLIYLSLITAKKNLLHLLFSLMKLPNDIDVEFDVYGPIKDHEYWRSCLQLASKLPNNIVFTYKGTVHPEEVMNAIQGYHFFVLSTLGENFGHAIYEALLAGRPVIISDTTPWQQLEERHAGFVFSVEQSQLPGYIEKAARMDHDTYSQYCQGAQKVATGYLKENNFHRQYLTLFQP